MSNQPPPFSEDPGQDEARPTLGDAACVRLREVYETFGLATDNDEAAHVATAADLLIMDAIDECERHGLSDDRWLVLLARLGATTLMLDELGWRLSR